VYGNGLRVHGQSDGTPKQSSPAACGMNTCLFQLLNCFATSLACVLLRISFVSSVIQDRQMTVAVSPSARSYNNSARSRVLSSSDTASPVRIVPSSGKSEASVDHKVTSVDRHDMVMHAEPSRAEIRVSGRRQNSQWIAAESNDSPSLADVPRRAARGSYAMALESSSENLIADKTGNDWE
jgi:hypothetical protein